MNAAQRNVYIGKENRARARSFLVIHGRATDKAIQQLLGVRRDASRAVMTDIGALRYNGCWFTPEEYLESAK